MQVINGAMPSASRPQTIYEKEGAEMCDMDAGGHRQDGHTAVKTTGWFTQATI